MSLKAAAASVAKSSHLMALHIIVSSCLLIAAPLLVVAALGGTIDAKAWEFAQGVVTAICTSGGVVIGASATRHTGEGYAKAKAGVQAPKEGTDA